MNAWLYEHQRLTLIQCDELKLRSKPGESEGDFRSRIALTLREKRDARTAELRSQYGTRLAALQARLENPAAAPAPAIREGTRNLLTHPLHGKPDDLTQIRGVEKVLERKLHKVGVFYFWQIAQWSPEDVRLVDEQLTSFHGRIEQDHWVDQASELASQPTAALPPTTEH